MNTWSSLGGDPGLLGWGTAIAYFAAASAACGAARSGKAHGGRVPSRKRILWRVLAVMLICLGFNKQLDLQSLLTATLRRSAQEGGWYDTRRQAQTVFVGVVAGGAVAISFAAVIYVQKMHRLERLGVLGMALLLGFVAVRTATFHHAAFQVDAHIAHLIELAGIGLIGGAALGKRVQHRWDQTRAVT